MISLHTFVWCFMLYALWLLPLVIICIADLSNEVKYFLFLFTFRYLRLIVGIIAYYGPFLNWSRRKTGKAQGRKFTGADVTVIIPTVTPHGAEFEETAFSALAAGCTKLIIVTVGEDKLEQAKQLIHERSLKQVSAFAIEVASKRAQVVEGLKHVMTPLVVFADDHVFWPAGKHFLTSLTEPFTDPTVGAVAPHKRVQRLPIFPFSSSLLNLIGCLYLERHNFDLGATNAADGSVFVVSGRTSAFRSSIVKDPEFTKAFANEMWFFDKVGPLNADDDNMLTRWTINHGFKIKFVNSNDALMETTLGVDGWRKFHQQIIRWARTTPRSNSTSLLSDRTVWIAQPWGVYSIYLSQFVNFALFTDLALVVLARNAAAVKGLNVDTTTIAMILWILASKLVKTLPHFARNPQDLIYLPFCIAFSYVHSFYKLYATITAGNVAWGSRPGLVK